MRFCTALCMVTLLAAAGTAVDKKPDVAPKGSAPQKAKPKINPTVDQLAGTWELTHRNGVPAGPFQVTRVFRKDGTQTITSNATNPKVNAGTYKIWGDEIHTTLDTKDESIRHSYFTVTKLTHDTLEVMGSPEDGGTTGRFKRVEK